MVRRTKEEAQETRNRLLDAAEVLFQAQGVSQTSLQQIAHQAGATRGAIYWHFKDKAALFNAMMDRVTLPLEAEVARASAGSGAEPMDEVEHQMVEALKLMTSDMQVRRVFDIATHKVEYVGEMNAVRERHLAMRNACLADMERALKRALRSGELPKGLHARSAALGLLALFDGLLQNWMLDPDAFDLLRVGGQVFDVYLRGLTTAPSP
jgi:TetR/AcrR family acrAB operon transcriptional repressor